MTNALAFEFRTKAIGMARSKTDGFQGVYFSMCTTLATRIRCDVSKND